MITSVNRKQIFKNIHSYWLSLADSSNAFIFGIKSKSEGLIHTHTHTQEHQTSRPENRPFIIHRAC